jgi:hypothetical protein
MANDADRSRLGPPISSFLVVVIALMAGALRVDAQTGCAGVALDAEGGITWVPKFCQEFNDPAPRPPDPAVWTYDLGGGGWGNRELETYCGPAGSPGNPVGCPSEALTSGTVYIDGRGHLVLRAIDVGGTWYSARLKTLGLQSFQYTVLSKPAWNCMIRPVRAFGLPIGYWAPTLEPSDGQTAARPTSWRFGPSQHVGEV